MSGTKWGADTPSRRGYVRSKPAANGRCVKIDRTPAPIKLARLAFLDTTNKPEHLK